MSNDFIILNGYFFITSFENLRKLPSVGGPVARPDPDDGADGLLSRILHLAGASKARNFTQRKLGGNGKLIISKSGV